ncbi:MAG TPA: hypothetical protein DCP90_08755 [Clostridiales bacterium]|nr:MAG: hypothetical protein A2Y22_03185 [Clostridiales bacterium GWD2_32_59]HAN10684.1 hypothetical protein [Clostridiales bacterium]
MKKVVMTLLVLLFLPMGMLSHAEGNIKVMLDGNEIVFADQVPVIVNGRTLVPARAVFEALGLTVNWEDATQKVTGEKEGKKIELYINNTEAAINGVSAKLDVPAQIINGRTMVPIRFIAESCNADVNWDAANNTVEISIDIAKIMSKTTLGGLKYGMNSNEVVKLIGNPEEKSQEFYQQYSGRYYEQWMYENKGIEILMVKIDADTKIINKITISGPCNFETNKGIKIGSTKEEVITKYKSIINSQDSADDWIVVGSVYGGVMFEIKEGKVSKMYMGASAE